MRAQDPHDRNGRRPCAAPPVPTGMREPRAVAPCSHRWGRTFRASISPHRTSSNSCRSSIHQARRSRPPPRSSANRSSPRGIGRYTIGPGQFDTQTITIHGYGKPMTSNISRKVAFSVCGLRAHRPDPGCRWEHQPGWRQLSAKLDRPHLGPDRADQLVRSTACRPTCSSRPTPTRPARPRLPRPGERSPLSRTTRRTTSPRQVTWLRRRAHQAASGPRRASITGAWPWAMPTSSIFLTNIQRPEALARAL